MLIPPLIPKGIGHQVMLNTAVILGTLLLLWLVIQKVVGTTSRFISKIRGSVWFARRLENRRHRKLAKKVTKIKLAAHARSIFQRKMHLVTTGVRKGHSHREAAAERNSATETMLSVVRSEGYKPYVISPSPREGDIAGVRKFYGLADLRQDYKNDLITKDHVIVMTDVDYYTDMAEIISYGVPVLAYTFQPTTVAGPVLDGCFNIKNNEVHYKVNGGKDVVHPIWNYNQDTVFVRDPVLTLWDTIKRAISEVFGIIKFSHGITACTIDQFSIGKHRNIVSIVPFAKCSSSVLPFEKFGTELARVNYQHVAPNGKVFNMISHINNQGVPILSLGEEGCYANVELPQADLEMLKSAHMQQMLLGKSVNLTDTQRRSGKDDRHAAIIHSFLTSELGIAPDMAHTPGQLARHYQSAEKRHDLDPNEKGKEYAREYAPGPLTQTAVFPTESLSNERATIEGRVDGPQAEARAREKISPKHYKYADEFVKFLVPKEGKGNPYPISYVEDQQQKPLQRARNDANRMHVNIDMKVKAFQKKEAYNAPNHPRNISTVPHGQNVRLASFTYAFKDSNLKKTDWYMPCNAPAEIARAMQRLAAKSDEIVETDFSRFDGTFLPFMRQHVEFAAYKRWVSKKYLEELDYLLNNELNAKAKTRMGLKYCPHCSRLSGSALTTDGNCICNAFTSYVANRESGMEPKEAWEKIGLVYGDDGARGGEATDETLSKTAGDLGFKLKVCNRARRGQPVSFLSRLFADPWTSPASVQSPARTLLKLHCTCDGSDQNSIESIGWAKTTAYLVTDALTPFIGDWCRAYQRNTTERPVNLDDPKLNDISYWAKTEESRNNSWPQDESPIWQGLVAKDLGVSEAELMNHVEKLKHYAGPVSGLPRLTTNMDLSPKLSVILDGEIHKHAGSIKSQADKAETTESKKNERKQRKQPKLQLTEASPVQDSGESKPAGKRSRADKANNGGPVKPRPQRTANTGNQCPNVHRQDPKDTGAIPKRVRNGNPELAPSQEGNQAVGKQQRRPKWWRRPGNMPAGRRPSAQVEANDRRTPRDQIE